MRLRFAYANPCADLGKTQICGGVIPVTDKNVMSM